MVSWRLGPVVVTAEVGSCTFTNGGTVMHISFGIPVRSKGVASSAHVHNTVPALGCVVGRNKTIVVVSRVNGPGKGIGTRLSLSRVISTIDTRLNMPMTFTTSYRTTSRRTTTLRPKRTLLLRGLHCCTRRRNGPINVSGASPTCSSTGGTVGASRGTFTGGLTSCTSY